VTAADAASGGPSPLLSRVLVTWLELTVVGLTGGFVGTTVGGIPAFVVYLATTLLSVGILFYNVNELVTARLRGADATAGASEAVREESVDEP